jgi:hypothetical protein
MNPIVVCLDLMLVSLLLLALWIGFRLEKRLKVLRDSQTGFVNAVAELNAGVEKAQSGLVELKSATLEARTELADRIQDARGMTARLERQAASAEQAVQRLEAAIQRASQLRPSRDLPPSARPGEGRDPGVPGPARTQALQEEPLVLRRAALSQPSETSRGPATDQVRGRRDDRAEAGANPAPRARARIDDDLFDNPLSLRGGRR